MINKLQLQSIISNYLLGGLIESVKWVVEKNNLSVRTKTNNDNLVCELECSDFPLEDSEVAIYETSQLNRLINITSGELDLNLQKKHKLNTKLLIDDANYSLFYTLSEIMLIPKVETVIAVPYDVEIVLDNEKIGAIIKAKNAIPESNHLVIESKKNINGDKSIDFTFGDTDEHTNKINYNISEGIKIEKDIKLPFNNDLIKEILNANKDIDEGKMEISDKGIMKLTFKKDNIKSKYYVLRKVDF